MPVLAHVSALAFGFVLGTSSTTRTMAGLPHCSTLAGRSQSRSLLPEYTVVELHVLLRFGWIWFCLVAMFWKCLDLRLRHVGCCA